MKYLDIFEIIVSRDDPVREHDVDTEESTDDDDDGSLSDHQGQSFKSSFQKLRLNVFRARRWLSLLV